MQPEVYTQDGESRRKPVKLYLMAEGDVPILVAVNSAGTPVAYLVKFTQEGAEACHFARGALESNDYDTSFASWDEQGAMQLD